MQIGAARENQNSEDEGNEDEKPNTLICALYLSMHIVLDECAPYPRRCRVFSLPHYVCASAARSPFTTSTESSEEVCTYMWNVIRPQRGERFVCSIIYCNQCSLVRSIFIGVPRFFPAVSFRFIRSATTCSTQLMESRKISVFFFLFISVDPRYS